MQNHRDGDEVIGPGTDGGAHDAADTAQDSTGNDAALQRSPFPHPPWTVGLVLVAGVITLLFGVLVSPIWLVVGSPVVIVLVLWLWIRLVVRPDDGP